jgi:hypothetical protein
MHSVATRRSRIRDRVDSRDLLFVRCAMTLYDVSLCTDGNGATQMEAGQQDGSAEAETGAKQQDDSAQCQRMHRRVRVQDDSV